MWLLGSLDVLLVRTNGASEAYRYIFSNTSGHTIMEIGQVSEVRPSGSMYGYAFGYQMEAYQNTQCLAMYRIPHLRVLFEDWKVFFSFFVGKIIIQVRS